MVGELARWAVRRRRAWRIRGLSMEPELRDGEIVLIDPRAQPVVGDIVVCRHPFRNLDVVKRITAIDGGFVTLWSPRGAHSAQFGRVAATEVKGRVTASLSRFRLLAPTEVAD